MMLDLVTDYISNGNLRKLAQEAGRVLTDQGVILGSLLSIQWARSLGEKEFSNGLVFPRQYGELCRLLTGFKPVFLEKSSDFSIDIFAFAKNQSAFTRVLVTKRKNLPTPLVGFRCLGHDRSHTP